MIRCNLTAARRTLSMAAVAALSVVPKLEAQSATSSQRQLTAADYARAEKQLAFNTSPLVFGAGVVPSWLPDERFTYRVARPNAARPLILIDPARATRTDCSTNSSACPAPPAPAAATAQLPGMSAAAWSPDRKRYAFIRDWNLFVTEVDTKKETQVTTDGVKDFGYATDNAGWIHSDNAIVLWSPDSKKIATFQQDQRNVGEMHLLKTRAGRPELESWKYPLPGDSIISTIQRVIIDISGAQPTVVRLQMPPDEHRSSVCDHVSCVDNQFADVQWFPDGSKLAFVSSTRDHKMATLRIADATTGAVRDVLREKVATQFESGDNIPNWRVLPSSNEVLWFSERDDWGQLYLYDLNTGALKNKVTSGVGNVYTLLHVDEKARQLFFIGLGKETNRDPYFRHLYRIGLDGKELTLLTPEDGDHNVMWSPSKKYFVDSWSRPDLPPTTVLRDGVSGKLILTLEKADISRLLATGWKAPSRITVKARDGKTDIYGLMFTPTNLDSTKKYPIINYIYPGPQTGSVGSRSFVASRGDHQALAELGFVVVAIDGMGTPMRSKSFHDAYYGRMGDNTLPDQIAGMKELATRYKFIDINQAGMWGHSGGGFATASAMFRYPEFFKVGIAESGNHDNRVYEDDWGERYQGLLKRNTNGTDNYEAEANQTLAKNLQGKLLLAHGTIDDNVPPDNTLLVADALIKANKSFDLLMLPNQTHGYGAASFYMMRRRWDYFVSNLMGAVPPKDYVIGPKVSP